MSERSAYLSDSLCFSLGALSLAQDRAIRHLEVLLLRKIDLKQLGAHQLSLDCLDLGHSVRRLPHIVEVGEGDVTLVTHVQLRVEEGPLEHPRGACQKLTLA